MSSGEVAVAGVEEVGAMVVVGILDMSMPPVRQMVFADISESHEKKSNPEVR